MLGKKFNALFIGASLVLLAGCAAVKVKKEVEFPARQLGMVNSRKLAVFNINGDINGTFTSKVEAYFSNIDVHGNRYFEVLERQMLDKIIAEQRMVSRSGLFNEKDAVKLGRLSGADTLITGAVSMPPMSVSHRTKEEQECKDAKCKEKETIYSSCVDKNVNLDFTLKAVGIQQGNILFTQTYSGKGNSTECDGGKSKSERNRQQLLAVIDGGKTSFTGTISETDLRNMAITQVLDNLRKDVAPYQVTLNIEFMEKDDSMSSATKDRLADAMEYIRQGRMDRACEIFKDALTRDINSPALYYDSGVCAEVGGDLDKAEMLFNQADRKTGKPVQLISDAVNRIKTVRANQIAVRKQMH